MNKATLLAFCAIVSAPAAFRLIERGCRTARALTFLHYHIIAVSSMGIALSASKLNIARARTAGLTAGCAIVRNNQCTRN